LAIVAGVLIKKEILLINVNQEDLSQLVQEAKLVRADLEQLLEASAQVSDAIARDLERSSGSFSASPDEPPTVPEPELLPDPAVESLRQALRDNLSTEADPPEMSAAETEALLSRDGDEAEAVLPVVPVQPQETAPVSLLAKPEEDKFETYREVEARIRQGESITDIAKQLGIGQGEVLLMRNLLQKKDSHD
jgi:hypothetical protein